MPQQLEPGQHLSAEEAFAAGLASPACETQQRFKPFIGTIKHLQFFVKLYAYKAVVFNLLYRDTVACMAAAPSAASAAAATAPVMAAAAAL